MFPYLSAVMPQIAYAHSVREFIRELLKRFIPGRWIDRVISDSDAKFDAKLDAAFAGLDEKTATDKDYCAEVVSVLCDEVSRVCEVLRLVCVNRGYENYAETFLSTEKFIRLLLRRDTAKLKRMNAALADNDTKPLCVLLREVGAILEDRPSDDEEAFGAAEMKKADAELKAIAADVKKTMQAGFENVRHDISEVSEKVGLLKGCGKRRSRHAEDKVAFCIACVDAANGNSTLRNGLNGKAKMKDIFVYYRRKLEAHGVGDFAEFSKTVHAYRAREYRARLKALEAKRGKVRQSTTKNGILRGMKRNVHSAFALALAIACGLASPLRSDASVRKGFYGLVDDVRLVRRALSPSEFISFKRPPSGLMLLVK